MRRSDLFLCLALYLVVAISLTGCSVDTKTRATSTTATPGNTLDDSTDGTQMLTQSAPPRLTKIGETFEVAGTGPGTAIRAGDLFDLDSNRDFKATNFKLMRHADGVVEFTADEISATASSVVTAYNEQVKYFMEAAQGLSRDEASKVLAWAETVGIIVPEVAKTIREFIIPSIAP